MQSEYFNQEYYLRRLKFQSQGKGFMYYPYLDWVTAGLIVQRDK